MKRIELSLILLLFTLCIDAQKSLLCDAAELEFIENLRTEECEKETDGKTPLALIFVATEGMDEVRFEEAKGRLGNVYRVEGGWNLWIAKSKVGMELTIYTNEYKPLRIKTNSPVESGKKYRIYVKAPIKDGNAGKSWVRLFSNRDCDIEFVNQATKRTTKFAIKSPDKGEWVQLPYGKYRYSACTEDKYSDDGVLNISYEPYELQMTLHPDMSLVKIITEKGNAVHVDKNDIVSVEDSIVKDAAGNVIEYSIFETMAKYNSNINVTISRDDYHDTRSILVNDEVISQFIPICGSLKIDIKHPKERVEISATHNGNKVNTTNRTILPALGEYDLIFSKYGYESVKRKYSVGIRKNLNESVKLKREVVPHWFINYTYSPSAHIGLMAGYAKYWGVYGSIKTSTKFWESFYIGNDDWTFGNNTSYALSIENAVMPEDWNKYYVNSDDLVKKAPLRVSASIGLMKSLSPLLYVYAGAGYGKYKTIYENPNPLIEEKMDDVSITEEYYFKDRFFSTYDLKGMEIECGLMYHSIDYNISIGWSHLFASKQFGDINIGIGINLHRKN